MHVLRLSRFTTWRHLAGLWGRWNWTDPRFVHQARLPCSPEHLVDYAHSVASIHQAHSSVWRRNASSSISTTPCGGGVIGDDGLGGIRLGQGDPEGEAFSAFQQYVKTLQQRGVSGHLLEEQ